MWGRFVMTALEAQYSHSELVPEGGEDQIPGGLMAWKTARCDQMERGYGILCLQVCHLRRERLPLEMLRRETGDPRHLKERILAFLFAWLNHEDGKESKQI